MNDDVIQLEIAATARKFHKLEARAVRTAGQGASNVSLSITQDYLGIVADHIRTRIAETHKNTPAWNFLQVAADLGEETLALIGLQGCLHIVARGEPGMVGICRAVGKDMASECWAKGLTTADPKLAARIERGVRKTRGTVEGRRKAAMRIASRAGYHAKEWPMDLQAHAGSWLVDAVVSCLPEVFYWHKIGQEYAIGIQPGAVEAAEGVVDALILSRPVFQPRLEAPQPWNGWMMTNDDPRVSYQVAFMRTRFREVAAAAKSAIKSGAMQPALDGVNALQAVPWRINKRVLGVIQECKARGLEVSTMPGARDLPVPRKPEESASDQEKTLWRIEAEEAEKHNKAMRCERIMLAEDLATAERLAEADRFYTPMNMDWRGRVYSLCHFNFQRDDRVRALFEFADGEPIGEEGLWWLKVHVANCGAFDKIDKKPLAERVAWVDANLTYLMKVAADPFSYVDYWKQADGPFLFLAAVQELSDALTVGPSFITTLPVSFDGSCSGLQHLSAMTRDEDTAKLVNLIGDTEPQDVYATVATRVMERVQGDVGQTFYDKSGEPDTAPNQMADLFLKYGIDRKLTKRNVMTYSYSSKKYGMASQQQVDLMADLEKQVLKKELPEHPFAPFHKGPKDREGNEIPGKAARYIAGHVFETIEERIFLPAKAMRFLQSIAKALAHEGKPVRWTSPVGIPWVNRYHERKVGRLRLWMHDKGVRKPTSTLVALGDEKAIDKEKAANGVAPNFVHALDGAHLLLTVNASGAEGITSIATVHDSFGCLASQAGRFNEIIRAELVRMYETHDVLSDVLEQAKCDLTDANWHRLPTVPEYGALNLMEIKNAAYAFA